MFSSHHITLLVRSIFSPETEPPRFPKELFTWIHTASRCMSEATRLTADKWPELLYVQPPEEFYSLKKQNYYTFDWWSYNFSIVPGRTTTPTTSPFLTLILLLNFLYENTIWHQFLWSSRLSPSAPVSPLLILPPARKQNMMNSSYRVLKLRWGVPTKPRKWKWFSWILGMMMFMSEV